MSAYAYDVTTADFKEKVFDVSMTTPVVVDFWAEWCAPCKVLKPLLEKLADEYGGRFILAKVDSDANPDLAGHFGIRSLPTVAAFVDGQPVDGFTGAKTEAQIREFLDRFLPPAAEIPATENLLEAAKAAREAGDHAVARALLVDAIAADPEGLEAQLALAELCLENGALEEAEPILTALSERPGEPDTRLTALLARLALVKRNAGVDTSALQTKVDADPDNHQLRMELADALAGAQNWRGALEQLLISVKKDKAWNEGAARKAMLNLFELLSSNENDLVLVREFRTQLARTLN